MLNVATELFWLLKILMGALGVSQTIYITSINSKKKSNELCRVYTVGSETFTLVTTSIQVKVHVRMTLLRHFLVVKVNLRELEHMTFYGSRLQSSLNIN